MKTSTTTINLLQNLPESMQNFPVILFLPGNLHGPHNKRVDPCKVLFVIPVRVRTSLGGG